MAPIKKLIQLMKSFFQKLKKEIEYRKRLREMRKRDPHIY